MKKFFTFFVAMVALITIGNAQCGTIFSYPYSCDFSLEIQNGCWEVDDVNSDNYTWEFDADNSVAKYRYNPDSDADDDLYSPYFYLDGHQTLTFDYSCGNSLYPENFAVFLYPEGSDDWERLTETIEVADETYTTLSIDLSEYVGVYRIDFYCFSDADMTTLYIANFSITSNNPCDPISEYPYENNFSDIAQMSCWSVADVNDDGNTFFFDNGTLCYRWNTELEAWDDVYSPYFVLDGHQTLTFDYYCGLSSYPENLAVYLYDGSSFYNIMETTEVTNTSAITQTIDLSEYTGTYKIDFYCTSDANMYRLYIDNFKIESTIGVEDHSKTEFTLYPNPTSGMVNLSEVASRVEVYDFSGRMVMTDENVNSVNLSSQANGVYVFRITTNDDNVITKKVVKK
jgi:hypothetical protein